MTHDYLTENQALIHKQRIPGTDISEFLSVRQPAVMVDGTGGEIHHFPTAKIILIGSGSGEARAPKPSATGGNLLQDY